MSRWNLSSYLLVVIVLLVLVDPPAAFSREDTAYISFKRVGVSRHYADPYIVKKGEYLFEIIRGKYNVSEGDIYRILELVKRFNPQMKDMNVLYPGQKLLLPRKRSSGAVGGVHPSSRALPGGETEGVILKYAVKSGDNILGIIHKKFGGPRKRIYTILALVKRLNPRLKDLDSIYPGQILRFPSAARREARPSPAGSRDITIPEDRILTVIRHIVDRMYGSIVTDGSYCIPVPPSGEVKVDCSRVPVIEIDGGNTVLLDLSNRIPVELKRVIESTWKNYRVIGVKKREGISSLLERIMDAVGVYHLEKINRYEEIGDNPGIRVFVEWLVSKKSEVAASGRYAFNFVTTASDLLPLSVRAYVERDGLEIIEIMDGLGIAGNEKIYQSPPVQVLGSESGVALADSLLRMLGYSPVRDSEISILSGDGLSLSMKTDLLLNVEGTRVIVTSNRISDRVRQFLEERGDRIVFVPERRGKGEVIEDIVRAMKIPYSRGVFKFFFSQDTGKERGNISLPALRLEGGRALYLVDYDVDRDIYGLLNKEWKVTLVRY